MPIYVKPQILVGEQTGTVHVMVGSKHTIPGTFRKKFFTCLTGATTNRDQLIRTLKTLL